MEANGQLQALTNVTAGDKTSNRTSYTYSRGGCWALDSDSAFQKKEKFFAVSGNRITSPPAVHPVPELSPAPQTGQFVTMKSFGLLLAASLRRHQKSHACAGWRWWRFPSSFLPLRPSGPSDLRQPALSAFRYRSSLDSVCDVSRGHVPCWESNLTERMSRVFSEICRLEILVTIFTVLCNLTLTHTKQNNKRVLIPVDNVVSTALSIKWINKKEILFN
jgi:hypothetical protein